MGRSPGGGYGNPLQYCLENPHGQGSLAGYSPWGRKESDRTEWPSTGKWNFAPGQEERMSKDHAGRTEMPAGDGSHIWSLMCAEELTAFLSGGGSPSSLDKGSGEEVTSGLP